MDMVAFGRGCRLMLAVRDNLTGGVRYFLYDQLPLTVKVFCKVTPPCVGRFVCLHRCNCGVPISLGIPSGKLALTYCVHYNTAVHLD